MLTAIINTRSKGLIKWPAYAVKGHWAITVPLKQICGAEPDFTADYAIVSHQPTGYRVSACKRAKDYTKRLERLNALFGDSKTVKGLMRKYAKFSKADKHFLNRI
jgi:hypothetical protein